jgi:folate-binding protein YgfZ
MSTPLANLSGHVILEDRAVLCLDGEDRKTFLQGLISNDVQRVSSGKAIYTALLTPQGKYLYDFFVGEDGKRLLIDCERSRAADLRRRLLLHKLRSRVTIDEATDLVVVALPGESAAASLGLSSEAGIATAFGGGIAFVDPRLAALGVRAILPTATAAIDLATAGAAPMDAEAYDLLRLDLGIPDGTRDLIVEKSLPLECGFDDLNGIDWQKGCYMGQELTARMRYRGLVKKRLLPVTVDGHLPEPGTPVQAGEQEVGEMRSGRGDLALALLRLEYLPQSMVKRELIAGEARITPRIPPWAKLPAAAAG